MPAQYLKLFNHYLGNINISFKTKAPQYNYRSASAKY